MSLACASACARQPSPPQAAPPTAPEPAEGVEEVSGLDRELPSEPRAEDEETPIDRSDAAITRAIRRELGYDGVIPLARIDVKTEDGIVELAGIVPTVLAQERAVRIAQNVLGVRAVSNRINVSAPGYGDRAIARDVRKALAQDPATEMTQVDVSVTDQVVTLTGTVDSFQEKDLAEAVAKSVRGVQGVGNAIDVAVPRERPDGEIEADVSRRLEMDTLVDARPIEVEVDEGTVVLEGVVGSAAEKRQARWDAWVAGVEEVDDSGLQTQPRFDEEDMRKYDFVAKSDDDITRALRDVIELDPRINQDGVEISVTNGNVILDGRVQTQRARIVAERLARHTTGVSNVENNLEVGTDRVIPDAAVTDKLRQALRRNAVMQAHEVEVETDAGVVTLRGTVDSLAERAEAQSVAMGIRGVRQVNNQIQVDHAEHGFYYDPFLDPYFPYVINWDDYAARYASDDDAVLAQKIEREIAWHPILDRRDIDVSVEDGQATLSGTVGSYRQVEAAIENAYEAGAVAVHSTIMVEP